MHKEQESLVSTIQKELTVISQAGLAVGQQMKSSPPQAGGVFKNRNKGSA